MDVCDIKQVKLQDWDLGPGGSKPVKEGRKEGKEGGREEGREIERGRRRKEWREKREGDSVYGLSADTENSAKNNHSQSLTSHQLLQPVL